MVELLKQSEAIPASYPPVTLYAAEDFDSDHAAENRDVDVALIWQRIESHIAWRWTPRAVVWLIEAHAGDEWSPPLVPLVSQSAERWTGTAWESVTLTDAPDGLAIPSDGRFRITATVGAGTPPEPVLEAVRRLHEYSIAIARDWLGGDRMHTDGVIGSWAGKAIQLSGAADLLRPYRRA